MHLNIPSCALCVLLYARCEDVDEILVGVYLGANTTREWQRTAYTSASSGVGDRLCNTLHTPL